MTTTATSPDTVPTTPAPVVIPDELRAMFTQFLRDNLTIDGYLDITTSYDYGNTSTRIRANVTLNLGDEEISSAYLECYS